MFKTRGVDALEIGCRLEHHRPTSYEVGMFKTRGVDALEIGCRH
jgi:hypothetical protein